MFRGSVSSGVLGLISAIQWNKVQLTNVRRRSRILVRGGPAEFWPQVGALPKIWWKIRVFFPLKLPENRMDFKKSWGQGGRAPRAPWIRYWMWFWESSCLFSWKAVAGRRRRKAPKPPQDFFPAVFFLQSSKSENALCALMAQKLEMDSARIMFALQLCFPFETRTDKKKS